MSQPTKVSTLEGSIVLAVFAFLMGGFIYSSAHHNSPAEPTIGDAQGMHEAAIDGVSGNSNMDDATSQGTYTDTSSQQGTVEGGASGNTRTRSAN